VLRRFLGLPHATPGGHRDASLAAGPSTAEGPAPSGAPVATGGWTSDASDETATVRAIVAQLESMPPDAARFLAGFAYVLSRIANADFHVTDDEVRRMEQIVVDHGRISEAQAVVVVQIARTRAELFGSTEDYLVTREFRRVATDEQCLDLLRCCYLIGAADGTITAEESGTLSSIADELDVDQAAIHALRAEFAEQFAALQALRRSRTGG
jgi:uncharacterized tellurite resistance protein B-like protein